MTETAKAAAQAATTPTTFNFAEAVLDRSYPSIDVPVYLNEKAIQRWITAIREQSALELRIKSTKDDARTVEQAKALENIDAEIQELAHELRAERYTVTIRGISPETQQDLEDKSFQEFPREYEDSVHALSGATIKTEKESTQREQYFATLLRQAHLVSVTAPDGATDTDFADLEKVRVTWANLPLLARAKVDEAINESTITVDFYREIADEVF